MIARSVNCWRLCSNRALLSVRQLIVACNTLEESRLDDLFDRAQQNGVPDVRMLGPDDIKNIEPNCSVKYQFRCIQYMCTHSKSVALYQKGKGIFLYIMASSSFDQSNLFILTPIWLLWVTHSHTISARRPLTHVFTSLSIARHSFIYKGDWTGASRRERNCPSFEMAAKCIWTLDSLDWESGLVSLSSTITTLWVTYAMVIPCTHLFRDEYFNFLTVS